MGDVIYTNTTKFDHNYHRNTGWVLGISRGHNAGVCLLKDGEIVFAQEEERFSRLKYDGTPYRGIIECLKYTNKVDYVFVAFTMALRDAARTDYTGEDNYTGLLRKLGLIEDDPRGFNYEPNQHPQIIDLGHNHHKIHAAAAFYRSGFDKATALIVDGAGSGIMMAVNDGENADPSAEKYTTQWETESIINCSYPAEFETVFKAWGSSDSFATIIKRDQDGKMIQEPGTHFAIYRNAAGIVKTYEAITELSGFSGIEAGKLMGLAPYGKKNPGLPPMYNEGGIVYGANRNLFVPQYPQSSRYDLVNIPCIQEAREEMKRDKENKIDFDATKYQIVRDLAWQVQDETEQQVLKLIIQAAEVGESNNVVIAGGYGLNCVANYKYLDKVNELGINLFVDAISSDAGTHVGAALWGYHGMNKPKQRDTNIYNGIYYGPEYKYTDKDFEDLCRCYNAEIKDATHEDVIDLILDRNIVALFQGRSELGPRALGNRSLLYDPTDPDGKEFVNNVKKREYFRPFAGSILEEDAPEWFDMKGLKSSPHMMYAMNCQPGVEEKIPSIIHVDGTCRIQTVNREENPHYYDIIKAFKDRTGTPILFNTSFNLGGAPLVETLEDAICCIAQPGLDHVYLPEYGKLITRTDKEIIAQIPENAKLVDMGDTKPGEVVLKPGPLYNDDDI